MKQHNEQRQDTSQLILAWCRKLDAHTDQNLLAFRRRGMEWSKERKYSSLLHFLLLAELLTDGGNLKKAITRSCEAVLLPAEASGGVAFYCYPSKVKALLKQSNGKVFVLRASLGRAHINNQGLAFAT